MIKSNAVSISTYCVATKRDQRLKKKIKIKEIIKNMEV